jgi:ADP-dependent NAD(P)H-hydrate dehydratase / NAD(P)H-hydrate epimerase
MPRPVHVVTGDEAGSLDSFTVGSGVPSRALMQRAGAAAAAEISLRHAPLMERGILLLAGPGNNGGDAWVVARALAAVGHRVRVCEPVEAKTDDARAERELALPLVTIVGLDEIAQGAQERIVIDGLLGTGSSGAPRGEIERAIRALIGLRERGARVIALDLPSGLDATTGEASLACPASLTLTFGTIKRGLLVARSLSGRIAVLDIGLGEDSSRALPELVDERWAASHVPPIAAEAHKGGRRKIAIVGGSVGMAGSIVLAARGAHRSGAGMVKAVVAEEVMSLVQRSEPAALVATWERSGWIEEIASWADVVAIGPGLGVSAGMRSMTEALLSGWSGPVLMDADALNNFAGDADALGALLAGRRAVVTPHPMELGRLLAVPVDEVLRTRFEIGAELAARIGAAVLLKGVPTVVSGADGRRLVSGAGTPALAAAGSGDVLAGMIATLLAQGDGDAVTAAAVGAVHHGRAAEIASGAGGETMRVRGVTLDDVLAALPATWGLATHLPRYPVIAELPDVAEGERIAPAGVPS